MENKTDFFSSHLEFTNLKCYEGERLSFKNMCKMPISRRMDKEAVVHIHHGILLSH